MRRKCSLLAVEGCSPKTNRVISPIVKYTEKMGPGKSVHYKEVFTMRGFTVQMIGNIFNPICSLCMKLMVCSSDMTC